MSVHDLITQSGAWLDKHDTVEGDTWPARDYVKALRACLARAVEAVELFRLGDTELSGLKYQQAEGGDVDCWTDSLIKANDTLADLDRLAKGGE